MADKIKNDIVAILNENKFEIVSEISYGSEWDGDYEFFATIKFENNLIELTFINSVHSMIANIDYNIKHNSNQKLITALSNVSQMLSEYESKCKATTNAEEISALYDVEEQKRYDEKLKKEKEFNEHKKILADEFQDLVRKAEFTNKDTEEEIITRYLDLLSKLTFK